MRYAVYFTWADGTDDSIHCDDALDRDLNIKGMLERDEFIKISWCPIYKSGEYGKHHFVKGDW